MVAQKNLYVAAVIAEVPLQHLDVRVASFIVAQLHIPAGFLMCCYLEP